MYADVLATGAVASEKHEADDAAIKSIDGRGVMSETLKENIGRIEVWMRLLYMLLFGVIYGVAKFLVIAVVVFQFGFVLLSARTNTNLLRFGAQLSHFVYQILLYLSFNTELRPFPFSDWPTSDDLGGNAGVVTKD